MQARIKNPAMIIPEAMQAIQALGASFHNKGVPEETLALVHLRASQINGCSSCVHAGAAGARKAGESEDRLATVAAWREAPDFTDAERAALALTEAVTRPADRPDPVPDEIWEASARPGRRGGRGGEGGAAGCGRGGGAARPPPRPGVRGFADAGRWSIEVGG